MKPYQMEKKQRLETSAVKLFLEKGIEETSVSEIVKDANLAKGTFYVYYKDKSELIHAVIVKKKLKIIAELITSAKKEQEENDIPWSCAFLKRLLLLFKEYPQLLKMMHHAYVRDHENPLSYMQYQQHIDCFDTFISSFQREKENKEEAFQRFSLLMEISATVCYNALFYERPASLEAISDMFYTLMCHSFACGKGGIK